MKEIPQEHKELVLARMKKAMENPERLLDWDEVSKQLDPGNTKKNFDAKKFNGVLKVNEDALLIQKR